MLELKDGGAIGKKKTKRKPKMSDMDRKIEEHKRQFEQMMMEKEDRLSMKYE